jgi:hypothetical protein
MIEWGDRFHSTAAELTTASLVPVYAKRRGIESATKITKRR